MMHHAHTVPAAPSTRTELPVPRNLTLILSCLAKEPAAVRNGEARGGGSALRPQRWSRGTGKTVVAGTSGVGHRAIRQSEIWPSGDLAIGR